MPNSIPYFYRFCFTIFDPLLAAFGSYGAFFDPLQTLQNYTPDFVNPPAVETLTILDVKAGFCLASAYLQAVLLRARPDDIGVWRTMQTANTVVSLGMLGGILRSLAGQGRLNPSSWRSGELISVGLTSGLVATRLAFLAGIGIEARAKREDRVGQRKSGEERIVKSPSPGTSQLAPHKATSLLV